MSAPATAPDDLPIAAWAVLIAKAAVLGFVTPGPVGSGPAGYRAGDADGGLS